MTTISVCTSRLGALAALSLAMVVAPAGARD